MLVLAVLAHPAVYISALVVVLACGLWDWNQARRLTGRCLITTFVSVMLLVIVCTTLFGAGIADGCRNST